MEDKKYGEFNNFDDFFNDLLTEFGEVDPAPARGEEHSAPARREKQTKTVTEEPPQRQRGESADEQPRKRRGEPADEQPRKRREELSEELPRRRETPSRSSEAPREEKTASRPAAGKRTSSRTEKKETAAKEPDVRKSIPFFLVLAAVTVIAWCLPLRPTESVSEKRTLDIFPEYSWQALLNGDYYSAIESWFSDTFTFRERWIGFSDRVERLYGIKTVAIHGDLPTVDTIPIPTAVPKAEPTPTPAADPVQPEESTAQPEVTPEPEEPEEESWGGVVIDEEALIADRGAKLQIGDSIFVYPGFNQYFSELYAQTINRAGDLLEGKANFYCVIAPHSATTMLTRADREKYGFVIEEDALSYIFSMMNDNVKPVNVIENLQKHNDEYIAFRSDPHWTAMGAYYAYEEWCKAAGKTPVPISEYKEYAWEDFFGTYYYASGEPKEIRDNPDTVFAYEPPGDVHLYLDFNNSDSLGAEYDLLLDRSTRKVDQYVTFLTSDQAKATLINNDITDGSACLVLKTSFGNPFVYYLTQHYQYVYVVDMRYFMGRSVSGFVDKFHVSDVIVIHATDLCYEQNGIAVVGRLLK